MQIWSKPSFPSACAVYLFIELEEIWHSFRWIGIQSIIWVNPKRKQAILKRSIFVVYRGAHQCNDLRINAGTSLLYTYDAEKAQMVLSWRQCVTLSGYWYDSSLYIGIPYWNICDCIFRMDSYWRRVTVATHCSECELFITCGNKKWTPCPK